MDRDGSKQNGRRFVSRRSNPSYALTVSSLKERNLLIAVDSSQRIRQFLRPQLPTEGFRTPVCTDIQLVRQRTASDTTRRADAVRIFSSSSTSKCIFRQPMNYAYI